MNDTKLKTPTWREALIAVAQDCAQRAAHRRRPIGPPQNGTFDDGAAWAWEVIADEYFHRAELKGYADERQITREAIERIREFVQARREGLMAAKEKEVKT